MGEVTPFSAAQGLPAPEPINAAHDLSRFDCGKVPLDNWLKQRTLKSEGPSARTYVVRSGSSVVAYYSLASGGMGHPALPGRLRRNMPDPVPVMLLGRLAVDRRFQGQGIGGWLIKDAMLRAAEANKLVGFRALLLHAIDDEALSFYAGFGFIEYPPGSKTLFLPIETITARL